MNPTSAIDKEGSEIVYRYHGQKLVEAIVNVKVFCIMAVNIQEHRMSFMIVWVEHFKLVDAEGGGIQPPGQQPEVRC